MRVNVNKGIDKCTFTGSWLGQRDDKGAKVIGCEERPLAKKTFT